MGWWPYVLGVVSLRAALVAILVTSCGGVPARAPSESPPRSPPPRALTELAPPACRVEAARAEGLLVAPEEGDPFTVAIADGTLAFTPTEDDRRLAAHVDHPLRFRALAPLDDQRLVLADGGDFAAGAVRAVAGSPIVSITRGDRALAVHVVLGRRAPLEPQGVEIVAGPLDLACDGVRSRDDPMMTSALPRHVTGGELRVATTLPLVVRPVRAAPTSVEVRPRAQGGFVPVWMIDRQGDDARVSIAFSDGAAVSGWVPLSALREASAAEAELLARVTAAEPSALALSLLGERATPDAPPAIEGYVGPASLRPASAIAATPGHAPWARSADTPLEVEVRWLRGAPHVELLAVPGMWIPSGHAWAERGDVSLPTP